MRSGSPTDPSRMPRYQPSRIEPKWQEWWDTRGTFATPRLPASGPNQADRPRKAYVLDMFPYPSGEGLHVGHPEGYTATDIVTRFERMRGATVMHPMGFDAFGLPAEEYAIRTGTPPRESTERNIANFTRQLKMLGFSYDWNRALATTDPDYVRWTQWIRSPNCRSLSTWSAKGRPPSPATATPIALPTSRRHR